jgi:hypothetical protein
VRRDWETRYLVHANKKHSRNSLTDEYIMVNLGKGKYVGYVKGLETRDTCKDKTASEVHGRAVWLLSCISELPSSSLSRLTGYS